MMNDRPTRCLHAGVIPYRIRDGHVEILLVTSRTRRRWVIPKGHVEPHLNARESARLEAYEEAGVLGRIHPVSLGYYEHGEPPERHLVEVFLMEVERELRVWPEAHERVRQWMPLREARTLSDEEGLKPILDASAELFG